MNHKPIRESRRLTWRTRFKIVGIIAAIMMTYSAIGEFVAYPTQEHRDVANKFAALSAKTFDAKDPEEGERIYKSAEYKAL